MLFDENRPELKGFNAFYENRIRVYLEARESERLSAFSKSKTMLYLAIGFGILASVIAFWVTRSWVSVGVGSAMILAAIWYGYKTMTEERPQIKQFLMQEVCEFIGWKYSQYGFAEPDLQPWQESGLLAKCDRSRFEDQITGQINGAKFKVCDAVLERKLKNPRGEPHWQPVFHGRLVDVDFPRKFLGRTVVLREAGVFNPKRKNGMKKVGLVDPVFEKIFEVYSTDQVEARYLLSPDFMQKCVDLETSVDGKKLRLGFLKDALQIAIETPFELEDIVMFSPLTNPEPVQMILNEVNAIFNVIEGVSNAQ